MPARMGPPGTSKSEGRSREQLLWLLCCPTFWVVIVVLGALCTLYITYERRAAAWLRSGPEFTGLLLHSQTFWIAVGALGTVLTLCFIYKQVAGARNVSAYQFLREQDDRFRSPEMRRCRSNLARVLLTNPAHYDLMEQHANEICGYFEELGLLLRKGIAPRYLIWTMFDRPILGYWQLLSPYIRNYRKQERDDTIYSEFEYLWKKIARFEKNALRCNKIGIDEVRLQKYLHAELRVSFRRFRSSDLGRIMEIERSSFDVDAYDESQFKQLYKDFPGGFRVAEISNFVVGYVAATAESDVGEIDSMAVDPDYRRLRIGRQLLEFTLKYFESERPELRCYRLQVRTTNLGAVHLYERLGFQHTNTLKGYYKDGADAFEMEMQAVGPGSG
ncbi:MAG: GNAT family N-acetyltransferase [Terriglobia bacterium]